jgi:hypothetical protein
MDLRMSTAEDELERQVNTFVDTRSKSFWRSCGDKENKKTRKNNSHSASSKN